MKGHVSFRKHYGRLYFILHILDWATLLYLKHLSKKHVRDGRKQLVIFSFDDIGHLINIKGIYEKDKLDTLFQWFDSLKIDLCNAAAVDVGANIGNHSIYFSRYFKHVYAFEPNPRTHAVLKFNTETIENIECFCFGLSDQEQTVDLSVDPNNIGGSSVVVAARASDPALSTRPHERYSCAIDLRKLDSLERVRRVRLIKIDVEGHEWNVINGARRVIEDEMPIILFEQNIEDFTDGSSRVVELLRDMGYHNFAILAKHPEIALGGFWRFLLVPIARLIFGNDTHIRIVRSVPPGAYPFIIALPNWFPMTVAKPSGP